MKKNLFRHFPFKARVSTTDERSLGAKSVRNQLSGNKPAGGTIIAIIIII